MDAAAAADAVSQMGNADLSGLRERYVALREARDPAAREAYWEWRDAGGELACVYVVSEPRPSVPVMLALRRPVKVSS